MTIRELLSENINIGNDGSPYLSVIGRDEDSPQWYDIVSGNEICKESEKLLDREVISWRLSFDMQDIDVVMITVIFR